MNTIQNILLELYAIDPDLQEHEEQLKQVIEKIIAQKPQVKIDDVFVKNLRKKILGTESKKPFTFSLLFMNNKLLWAGTAALLAVLVIGVPMYLNQSPKYSSSLAQLDTSIPSGITSVAQRAFGPLGAQPLSRQESMTLGRGGGGGENLPAAAQTDSATANSPVVNGKMIVPAFNYSFKYTGAPFTVEEKTLPVYKRVKSPGNAVALSRLISGTDNGFIDLNLFKNTKLQNITMIEDRDDAFMINFDFLEGRVSLSPAYERWYQPKCVNGVCEYARQLTEKDVPPSSTLIDIANKFVADYNIDLSHFGQPQVDDQWKTGAVPLNGEPMYIPETISVVYPLIVDNQEISESSGIPFGLRIQVDIRKMKVQGAWNIGLYNYEKSNYEVETNVERILKVAETGMGVWYGDTSAKKELQLGAPERIYIPHYQYIQETLTSNELYIPALRFPVLNVPNDQPYFQKFITVPLVKEVLDQYDRQNGGPMPIDGGPVQILRDTGVTNQVEPQTK